MARRTGDLPETGTLVRTVLMYASVVDEIGRGIEEGKCLGDAVGSGRGGVDDGDGRIELVEHVKAIQSRVVDNPGRAYAHFNGVFAVCTEA